MKRKQDNLFHSVRISLNNLVFLRKESEWRDKALKKENWLPHNIVYKALDQS